MTDTEPKDIIPTDLTLEPWPGRHGHKRNGHYIIRDARAAGAPVIGHVGSTGHGVHGPSYEFYDALECALYETGKPHKDWNQIKIHPKRRRFNSSPVIVATKDLILEHAAILYREGKLQRHAVLKEQAKAEAKAWNEQRDRDRNIRDKKRARIIAARDFVEASSDRDPRAIDAVAILNLLLDRGQIDIDDLFAEAKP